MAGTTAIGRARDKTKMAWGYEGWEKERIEGEIISGGKWRLKDATNSTSMSRRVSESILTVESTTALTTKNITFIKKTKIIQQPIWLYFRARLFLL